MLKYNDKEYVCLLDVGMDVIRGKWKAVLICHMSRGTKRFLELQRITHGVSHKVLNEKLKELENDNIIEKIVYPEVPPKVEYKLTPLGVELAKCIESLEKWSVKNFSHLVEKAD